MSMSSSEMCRALNCPCKLHFSWALCWTCCCIYETLQDDFPLASLPLLGYVVGLPSPSDGIHKDCVFKLQFKNHVYFFRAESDVTFNRYVAFVFLCHRHPTLLAKTSMFSGCLSVAFFRSSRQILLPLRVTIALNNFDETDRQYSLAPTGDWIRLSKDKGQGHCKLLRWGRHQQRCWGIKVSSSSYIFILILVSWVQ